MKAHQPTYLLAYFLVIAALALTVNGCAVKQPVSAPRYPDQQPTTPATQPVKPSPHPTPVEAQRPEVPSKPSSPQLGAAASLYSSAKEAMSQGNFPQAEMMLERALKIEPRNAHYWYTMAEAKYNQGQYSQTVHLCSKSKSLAGRNTQLLQLNNALSAKAKQRL